MASTITELQLYLFIKENNSLPISDLVEKLNQKCPDFRKSNETGKSLYDRMARLYKRIREYRRTTNRVSSREKLKLAEATLFLPKPETIPPPSPEPSPSPSTSTSQEDLQLQVSILQQENKALCAQASEADSVYNELQVTKEHLNNAKREASACKRKLLLVEKKYEETSAKLTEAEKRLYDLDSHNARRRESRHNATIVKLRKKILDNNQQIESIREGSETLRSSLERKTCEVQRLRLQKTTLYKNIYSLKNKLRRRNESLQKKMDAAEVEIHNQWLKGQDLAKSNSKLQKLLQNCEDNEIQTFDGNEYVIPIREIVLHLVKLNVSQRNVAKAIQVIIEKLTPMKIGRLPSYTTINKMVYEAKCLALLQAGKDMLPDNEESANVLMGDATCKRRTKYSSVVISTSAGLRNVGLHAIVTEDSETLVSITKSTFSEIAHLMSRLEGEDEEELSTRLYRSIKGTMSDSCAVMKKFHHLMNSEIGKHTDGASKVMNHYCFLHVIINFGEDACAHGLVDIDKCCYPPEAFAELHAKTSSTTYSAILLAARMFHRMGSEKYGRADMFESFLEMTSTDEESKFSEGSSPMGKSKRGTQIWAKSSYFEREVGNRAHITFHNGNALWYHREKVMDFLELQQAGNTSTETMTTLRNLLKMKVPLASARALGIIKCCITGPFQHAFDVICTNIYDMVPYTIKARESIQAFSVDASSLLEDPQSIYPDILMDTTEFTASLFHNTNDAEMDSLTILALQLILKNLLIKFERYCSKYLSEGEFAAPTADERNDLKNCPLTNRACESVMAALDSYIKSKPNATPGFLESLIMLKTLDLEKVGGLSQEEKEKHWKIAKKYSYETIAANKAKLRTILDSRRLMLQQQKSKMAMKVLKQKMLIKKLMVEMSQYGGGWRTGETVDVELEKLQSNALRKKALITHIQSMKHIYKLEDSLPSSKKKLLLTTNLSVELLKENLKQLLIYASPKTELPDFDTDEVTKITGTTVLSREQRTLLFGERVSILQKRLLAQRQKMQRSTPTKDHDDEEDVYQPTPSTSAGSKRTATQPISIAGGKKVFIPDPLYLVGKRVEHVFLIKSPESDRRTRTVFTGTVVSIVENSTDPLYTKYKIRYDLDSIGRSGTEDESEGEEEEEEEKTDFIYDLLIDYINGDLKVKHSKEYNGSCHCGAVQFKCLAPEKLLVLDCNCSICYIKQNSHFIINKSNFTLLKGEDNLTVYQYNTMKAKHMFCKTCGVQSFYIPRSNPDSYGINPRCLKSLDPNSVTVETFDGVNWEDSFAKKPPKSACSEK